MPKVKKIPSYTHHKPTGQARVRVDGRDCYLGPFGSKESRAAYARIIAEQFRPGSGDQIVRQHDGFPDISVNELLVRYLEFATTYYVRDAVSTGETENMKFSMRTLRELYGLSRAREFGPLALKAVRQHMITGKRLARNVINARVNRIRRIFKWAVSEELIPASTFEALRTVDGLRRGRSNARETEPVHPVADQWVEATKAYLPPPVADMVSLQRITGMRPGDVINIRPCDIDRQGEVWVYEPPLHKTEYLGRRRFIALGPKAQKIVMRYLNRSPQACLFSPQEADAWRREQRRTHRHRKTPVFPCELKRLERERDWRQRRRGKGSMGDRYTTNSYRRAIDYAVVQAEKAGVQIPSWHPNQLRHSRATEVRRTYGLEAAQVVLGHATADVTQIYAERDLARAVEIAKMTG